MTLQTQSNPLFPGGVGRRDRIQGAGIGGALALASAAKSEPAGVQPQMSLDRIQKLLPGFSRSQIATSGAVINAFVGGSGPALLLLHGHPQTAVCWHKIAPELAKHFTVVLTDLRGYGDSSKPEGGENHIAYSKRHMALDQVEVMKSLGHERFQVAGHDRGGRVLHRMLLDHPAAIERAAILDIAPTATMYANVSKEFATRYMWWFFLIQPAPMPETLIGDHRDFYLESHIRKQNKTLGAISPDALEEYRRCYTRETLHAVCEDYRAAAGIDLQHDAGDADKRIEAPLLVLWGEKGVVGATYDVLQTWREKARDVSGFSLPCGHYLPEEAPDLTLKAFMQFFHWACSR